jgi:L-iditol 2-dehydrogenase
MLEPLGVALHAVDLAHLRVGMRVAVLGCGPIGLMILQLAKLSGAGELHATDLLPHRVQAAGVYGCADAKVVEPHKDSPEWLRTWGDPGMDVVFEVAGSNQAVETAVDIVVPGGKIILVGIPSDNRTSFSAAKARRKGITFKMVRRMKHTYPRATRLVETGQVDVRALITHRFPLERVQEAFEVAARREGLKVLVEIMSGSEKTAQ